MGKNNANRKMQQPEIHARLMHTCAWCLLEIPEEDEVYGFGARIGPGIDLTGKEGQFVSLSLALKEKTVVAMVVTPDSPARQAGYDLVFLTCSQACAVALKDALEFEKEVFEDI